jgi:two-component system nitrogen regulation sensor histidine kinase GlnL
MTTPVPRRLLAALGRGAPRPPDATAVLGALVVPVVVVNGTNRFVFANHAAEQFFGISASQLAQLRLTDLLPADNPLFMLIDQVRAQMMTVADHDLTLESPRLQKTGISVQGTTLSDDAESVVLTFQDASTVRAMGQQLGYKSAARSVTGMAAILAHEVKNPLSGIRGAAQLLESTVPPHDQELCLLIRDEADRIRALVDRMEQFGDKPVERGAVNIHRVLEHVRKLAQSGFAAPVRFQEFYDPSLPPVWGHRDQLVQVLLNLVKNAAEAIIHSGNQRGEIVLSTAYRHGVRVAMPGAQSRLEVPLMVTIRDNGPGIPDDIRPHLFEPFITSKPSGSGLGLALVAKIMDDHGGLIEMDSRPGRTEFRLHLPVLIEDTNE